MQENTNNREEVQIQNEESVDELIKRTDKNPKFEENENESSNDTRDKEENAEKTEIRANMEDAQEYIDRIHRGVKYSGELDKFFMIHFPSWRVGNQKDAEKYLKALLYRKLNSLDYYDFDLKDLIKKYLDKSNISKILIRAKKIFPDELVGKPYIINTQNVQLNLKESVPIVESPLLYDNYFNIDVEYDANAQCPIWLGFIDKITLKNKQFAKYLQKIVGYCLTGSNVEQCVFILYGLGSNGKTIFVEILKQLFGAYSTVVSKKLLQGKGKSCDTELLNLIGKRIAIVNELEAQTEIKTDFFKKLVGLDTLGFQVNKQHVEFRNKAKIFMITNFLPIFSDYSKATTRRIKILPFENTFEGQNRNLFLMEDLQKELSGILNWAIEGYKLWEQEGLQEPKFLIDFKKDYINQMDPLGFFLDETCDFDVQNTCESSVLFDEYQKWCTNQNIKPMARNKLGTELVMRGVSAIRLTGGARGYKGLQLKTELCSPWPIKDPEDEQEPEPKENSMPLEDELTEACA